ncbi:MAG: prenyltransferase/squalene oxidase repeat-containing protein, partial [Chthoniobacteraceae bacterium]
MSLRKLCATAVLCALAFSPARAAEPAALDPVTVDGPTEEILRGALRWLASKQNVNGSWNAGEGRRADHSVAMTGYVLMAFMATGNLPEEGQYAKQVKGGLDFLLDSIGVDGQYRGVDGSKYMYNHGIATIALGELYGESRSPVIREKLQRAIRLIVTTQSERGSTKGGWRYQPRPGDADISVTVLQVVALRAAKNAGLDVPQQTIDDAVDYVRRCSVPGGGFAYQAGQWGAGFSRTAAAIYSLQVCGRYDDSLVLPGS